MLAVGGTTLSLSSGGSYGSESGWTDSTGGFSGLDNGFRYGLSIPSYQVSTLTSAGLDYGLRTTPDVSFNADPNTGVAVYDSVPYDGTSGWFDVGGTSAAAPAWAGLVALTDQGLAASGKGPLSTTQLLTDLYSLPSTDFHDITTGFNGYSAGTGYDLVTGLGTPKANLLVPALLAANGVDDEHVHREGLGGQPAGDDDLGRQSQRGRRLVRLDEPGHCRRDVNGHDLDASRYRRTAVAVPHLDDERGRHGSDVAVGDVARIHQCGNGNHDRTRPGDVIAVSEHRPGKRGRGRDSRRIERGDRHGHRCRDGQARFADARPAGSGIADA